MSPAQSPVGVAPTEGITMKIYGRVYRDGDLALEVLSESTGDVLEVLSEQYNLTEDQSQQLWDSCELIIDKNTTLQIEMD